MAYNKGVILGYSYIDRIAGGKPKLTDRTRLDSLPHQSIELVGNIDDPLRWPYY